MGRGLNRKLGRHAIVSVSWKAVRPVGRVKEAHSNDYRATRGQFGVRGIDNDRGIDGGVAVCITFTSDDIPDCELYCRASNARLVHPGPLNMYFSNVLVPPQGPHPPPPPVLAEPPEGLPGEVTVPPDAAVPVGATGVVNGTAEVVNLRQSPGEISDPESDYDAREPEPEVPEPAPGDLVWDDFSTDINIDVRAAQGLPKFEPRMKRISGEALTYTGAFALFQEFFPMQYITDHVLPSTTAELEIAGKPALTLDEFWLWLALHLIISLNQSYPQDDFFNTEDRTIMWHPPYLGGHMSENRFRVINTHLRLTSSTPPVDYRDKFWEVRDLYQAFNDHMAAVFDPGWIVCTDESMVIFTNPRCPGWVHVK